MSIAKKYFKPKTVGDAVRISADFGVNASFIAGGTDAMVNKFQGNNTSSCFIDLSEIDEMTRVERQDNYLKIGAAVTLADLQRDADVVREFPSIGKVVNMVASPVIRKSATIGGNLLCENRCIFFNQSEWWREAVGHCLKCSGDICIATGGNKNCFSKFVSDLAVLLISMDASLEVCTGKGGYITPLEEIYSGKGIQPHSIGSPALIKSVNIPLNEGFVSVYKKLRQRESMDFGSLTSVVTVDRQKRVKIVLGCIDPGPVSIDGHWGEKKSEMIRRIVKKCRIVDNDIYTRNYRKEMITVFLNRSFNELERLLGMQNGI